MQDRLRLQLRVEAEHRESPVFGLQERPAGRTSGCSDTPAGLRVDSGPNDAYGTETGQLRERMAKLEGLLEGLREAITRKRAA